MDMSLVIPGYKFGHHYICKLTTKKVYIYKRYLPSDPHSLKATLDIVDGKFVITLVEYDVKQTRSALMKAYNGRKFNNWVCLSNRISPTIIHINSLDRYKLMPSDLKVASDEEALVHLPTSTVLPIAGKQMKKNINVIDMLESADGKYIALLVKTNYDYSNVQLCVLETQTGKTEHYYIRDVNTVRLEYFGNGNKTIVYSKNICKGATSFVMSQPIFKGRIDGIAIKLYSILNQRVPLEVFMNIAGFMV
jgi:hypothetical protein